MNKNIDVFLSLLRAGLWESVNANLDPIPNFIGGVDWNEVYRMAEQQGVIGLVAAGIESVNLNHNANLNLSIPQVTALTFAGATIQMEQRNKAMNGFIAELVEKMRAVDIYTLLVKGQGVAQCYERPLWRPSGDVDFLLSEDNYKKAKAFLLSLSSGNKHEERYSQHLGMNIGQWYVEIHGTLRTGLAARVDRQVDAVQRDVLYGGNVRTWMVQGSRFKVQGEETTKDVQVFLPASTEDVFLVFTHFIKHFYKEGMTLRQLCDWCRLLYTYRESLDYRKIESWIRKSGLMGEWKAFYNLACKYLGMTDFGSGLTIHDSRYDGKAEKLMTFILKGYSGNKVKDTWQIAKIFPWKALRYTPSIFLNVNWLKIRERLFK